MLCVDPGRSLSPHTFMSQSYWCMLSIRYENVLPVSAFLNALIFLHVVFAVIALPDLELSGGGGGGGGCLLFCLHCLLFFLL